MFSNLDSKIFDDAEFKEDSVRELVVAPILSRLGYGPTGEARVARSKSLKHPFIRVGTRNHPVTTIPDYTIYIDGRAAFVLDAKAPGQDVLDPAHIQQAYSYAIHPEVRCEEFGLCNGRQLVAFSVANRDPLVIFEFDQIEERWDEIEKLLLPKYLREPAMRRFEPDFGTALKRMGLDTDAALVLLGTRLNLFGVVSNEIITASANCDMGFGDHCASFDFSPDMMPEVVAGLPEPLAERFSEALLKRAPYQAAAGLVIELDLTVRLGEETQGQWESFVPLIVEEIHDSRFNPEEVAEDPNDVPPNVFKLRDAFVIEDAGENP